MRQELFCVSLNTSIKILLDTMLMHVALGVHSKRIADINLTGLTITR